MSTKTRLQEPILDGGVSSINYFNGRLLNAGDLTRERAAHREVDHRLGRALGDGVAYGLEVRLSRDSQPQSPALQIEAGLAINRNGQPLSLGSPMTLELLRSPVRNATGPSTFSAYTPSSSGTYVAGQGVYLLTIAPIESRVGRAPVSGLGNEGSSCNADSVIDGVQFRLIQVDSSLISEELQDEARLRNRLAYRCFGVTQVNDFLRNPFGPPLERYGLLDELRKSVLSDCDVPLALLYWKAGGVSFVDMWSVRRRLTQQDRSSRWAPLIGDRQSSENEAMLCQFQEQIVNITETEGQIAAITAERRFQYLPPSGFLPVSVNASRRGFNYTRFFSAVNYREPVFIDLADLETIVRHSMSFRPVNLNEDQFIWLYQVRENQQALSENPRLTDQPYLVFTTGRMPFYGRSTYDAARFDYSNFSSVLES